MVAFCSAVNFLRVLVIGILQETGHVSLIRGNSTFKRGKTSGRERSVRKAEGAKGTNGVIVYRSKLEFQALHWFCDSTKILKRSIIFPKDKADALM